MQGIQSSMIPEKTEKRGLTPGAGGPLEAAKRYLDRQRESEASLAAMDDEEANDGRPAWLRRWQSGATQPTETTSSGKVTASGTSSAFAVPTPNEDRSATSMPHSGQSIEAAFAFETTFQYETELEAEETEDWLELSGDGLQVEALVRTQALPDLSRQPDEPGAQANPSGDDQPYRSGEPEGIGAAPGQAIRIPQKPPLSTTVPDPQAVRAAIFRLAQESSQRWAQAQEPTEPTVKGQSSVGMLSEGGTDSAMDPAGPEADNRSADFAEVARQLWAMPEKTTSSMQRGVARTDSELTSFALENKDSADGLAGLHGPEFASERSQTQPPVEALQGAKHDELTDSATADSALESRGSRPRTVVEQTAGQTGHGSRRAAAEFEPEWTLNHALSELRSEIRREVPPEATEDDAAKIAPIPAVTPATAAANLRGTQGAASDAPALAHDASNLLSALKLYSELLALSGVLQARHSHYAQDLKLLAARSEVLIDRLLASCGVAERSARLLAQGRGLGAEEDTLLDPGHLLATERCATETAPAVPKASRSSSRRAEASLNQSDTFAAEEVVATSNRDHAETSSLNASVLRGLETPLFSPNPAPQKAPAEDRKSSITAPEESRSRMEVMQPPSQDDIARLTEDDRGKQRSNNGRASASTGSEPINLVDLLTRWGGLLSMIARGPVEVKFGPHAALPIEVGEEAMERILVNLVHNAMTATRKGGSIRIGVGRADTRRLAPSSASPDERVRPASKMVLTVDDSGCGMSEQQIAKVLGMGRARNDYASPDPDVDSAVVPDDNLQSGRSHRRHGMGLQIVRELVAASGGELAIYSRCGVGTRIELRWPTLQPNAELETRPVPLPSFSARVDEGTSVPALTEQRRPPQQAHESDGASSGLTHTRIQQGFEGAIAC